MTGPLPHPAAAYWNRGLDQVPWITGADALMDGRDILEVLAALGLACPLGPTVLDVGCGTGRMAAHCMDYVGVDIAQDAVAFCQARGLAASRITGPADLHGQYALVLCLSVFTHIDADERRAYLRTFRMLAPRVLVDIIPGTGAGGVALWTADEAEFRQDVTDSGWDIRGTTDRVPGAWHRYFLLEVAPA